MTTNTVRRIGATVLLAAFGWSIGTGPVPAQAQAKAQDQVQTEDRHAGYYYPAPATREVYEARVPRLPGSDRLRRIGFVTVMTNEMLKNPYPPQFAIFAKGEEAEKLIISGLNENSYNTLYRARALFAMMTAIARSTQLFQEQPEADRFTFFDLAHLLGFEQITFTDGSSFAHRIELR